VWYIESSEVITHDLQSVPQLCRGNCGFYGSPSLDNYCSKCAKEHVQNTQDSLAAVLSAPTTSNAEEVREESPPAHGE